MVHQTFILSFQIYFLSTDCVPGTVPGTREGFSGEKPDPRPCFYRTRSLVGTAVWRATGTFHPRQSQCSGRGAPGDLNQVGGSREGSSREVDLKGQQENARWDVGKGKGQACYQANASWTTPLCGREGCRRRLQSRAAAGPHGPLLRWSCKTPHLPSDPQPSSTFSAVARRLPASSSPALLRWPGFL